MPKYRQQGSKFFSTPKKLTVVKGRHIIDGYTDRFGNAYKYKIVAKLSSFIGSLLALPFLIIKVAIHNRNAQKS